ncbi:MAG: MFS transporter [Planctomycetota bacterium]
MTQAATNVSESPTTATQGHCMSRLATVIASHPVTDAYSNFVPPLIGVLLVRCSLTSWQEASLIGIGSLTSGLSQPLFAWLADRFDTRIFAPIGILLAAIALSLVGLANSYASLVVIFIIGMVGVGAYHPIAAASAGQLAGARRTAGVTVFFTCGMVGATIGPLLSTRITALDGGFELLRWCMVPGLIMAVCLHIAIRQVPHAHRRHDVSVQVMHDLSRRWMYVILIFIGNAMRYSVNMALVYLYVQWAEQLHAARGTGLTDEAIATNASKLAGNLNACTMFGMGLGGLLAGFIATRQRERLLFIAIPVVFAPAIVAFTVANELSAHLLALSSGIGFAAIIPVSISVSQRLLPHRSSVASSLAMGGAWSVASIAPLLAARGIETIGMTQTFLATAAVLALSGIVGLPLRTASIGDVTPDRT